MSFLPSDAEVSDAGVFAPSTFQGYLEKKSPRGFLGKHMWQRRFFVLEGGNLSYHKDKQGWARGEKPIGVVRVDMIRDIQLPLESAHYGFRFDILAVGGHLFELMAPSEKSCTQWVRVLREEIGKRAQSVNDALRMVQDDHVADGFWKVGRAEDVKKLHSHAEAALPTSGRDSKRTSRAGSRESSVSRSRGTYDFEDDEEARDRAAALAVMMQEEADRKLATDGVAAAASPSSRISSSAPASAGHTPPGPPPPIDDDSPEEKTAEEKAQDFLKRQYTLGAVKAGGKKALRASIIRGTGSADLAEIEAQLPEEERGAARTLAGAPNGNANLSRYNSNSSDSSAVAGGGASPATPSSVPVAVVGSAPANGTPGMRRPIASYGDDDSDSDNELQTKPAAAAAAATTNVNTGLPARPSMSTYPSDLEDPSLTSPTPASPTSPTAAAAASAAAASAADDSPFISTILWKESPSGLFKVWQKRLFALQDGVLCYYKSKSLGLKKSNLAGTISIHQITKVVPATDAKKGTDFNLYTTEGRVYKLRAETDSVAKQWIAFIQACDPKRLGCTYPGLVMRESRSAQIDSAASGDKPVRGRLVAAGGVAGGAAGSKLAMSVLPATDAPSAVTTVIPVSPREQAADQEIFEDRTFWNFLRYKHSLLSIFYVKKKAAFPRIARWFLFLLDLIMNLIELVVAWFIRWFCYDRDIGPIESQIRLGVCALTLYGLFIGITAWQWTKLPESSAINALVRFIASSIGVILVEIGVWFFLYSCAQNCCPCITLDDGSRSLEDIQAEEEEKAKADKEIQHRINIEKRREKLKKKLDVKVKYRAEEEV